jgi:DNA polymerase
MQHITLGSETDFRHWRDAARTLVLNRVKPAEVTWAVKGRAPDVPEPCSPFLEAPGTFNVPAKFLALAQSAILHRDACRFALLYCLLWRLTHDHGLLESAGDAEVARAKTMAGEVAHDMQRMQGALRFREIGREPKSHYVAWFAPQHHIVEAAAPFFARRYADMPWSILTPDLCAHWDGHVVSFTPGIDKPADDRLEETWRRQTNKHRRNLPDASTVEPAMTRKARPSTDDLDTLREEAAACRDCPLWKDATQTVFGEGPPHAHMMLVGEQPGDKEDLAGKPFVGPAGMMLDRALGDAGIDRGKAYVTNAVKHFKFVPRGKIRLHQKPSTPEIRICRQWYERELAAVRPALVVAMGATAAQCVFGKVTPINKTRGRLIELADGVRALVTVHPSYLLRMPDQQSREREYQRFVSDLRIAAAATKSPRAA